MYGIRITARYKKSGDTCAVNVASSPAMITEALGSVIISTAHVSRGKLKVFQAQST